MWRRSRNVMERGEQDEAARRQKSCVQGRPAVDGEERGQTGRELDVAPTDGVGEQALGQEAERGADGECPYSAGTAGVAECRAMTVVSAAVSASGRRRSRASTAAAAPAGTRASRTDAVDGRPWRAVAAAEKATASRVKTTGSRPGCSERWWLVSSARRAAGRAAAAPSSAPATIVVVMRRGRAGRGGRVG